MSIYSTVIDMKKDQYSIYCQTVGWGEINHIIFEQERDDSKLLSNRVIFNVQHVYDLLYLLKHVSEQIGVIHRTYLVSNDSHKYILNVLVSSYTVVLYDDYDIVTVKKELFMDILRELQEKIEKYNRAETERIFHNNVNKQGDKE